MKKFEVTLSTELNVSFSNPTHAHHVFIESDWKESFFQFDSLDDVAKHIAYAFNMVTDHFHDGCFRKDIEVSDCCEI